MSTSKAGIPRYRDFRGPAIFRQGFRPFFFGAGVWGLAALGLWISVVSGSLAIPTTFAPSAWHAHEMLFGFAMAVIAGFLLTAIPNWTGHMPLQGRSLAVLFLVWVTGRIAMANSALIGAGNAAVLDLAFPTLLLAAITREILSGKNWRNLPIPLALVCLLVANLLTHLENAGPNAGSGAGDGIGQRLALGVIVLLISLIGGRIIPSFTRNWLAKRGEPRLPTAFNSFDRLCLGLAILAVAGWVVGPDLPITGALLLAAGLAGGLRLLRWRGHRTMTEPLVWSLHLGFAWVPLGFGLLGGAIFLPGALPATVGLHALATGAIGSMTVAVMTRATLSHTKRELTADSGTSAIFVLIALAASTRVAAPMVESYYLPLLTLSAVLWIGAFGLFSTQYGRYLLENAQAK